MSSHDELNILNEHLVHSDINLSSTLCENIGAMHLSDDYSDVTLIVCGERFKSHKMLLAARSQYFRALLSGGFKESTQQEIELKDVSLSGFKSLLEYIYTGRMSLKDKPEKVILDILDLAQVYGCSELETPISAYLNGILSIENVCLVFNAALLHQLELLIRACHEYVDENACEVMKHESFLKLSPDALDNLVSRDSFYAPEIEIFFAVQAWLKANPDAHGKTILNKIQLSLISVTDLSNVVWGSKLYSAKAILNAIRAQTQTRDPELNYRGRLPIGVNVAHPSHGAEVIRGENSEYLLNGDTTNYNKDKGYTSHTITDSTEGILVKLGAQRGINHIKMLLWDMYRQSYSYYVEVSTNQKNWVRVIDYKDYHCRGWQYLYFELRAVRYIRIVGTNSTKIGEGFRLVSFEAYYTNHTEKHRDGFVIPTQNVATTEQGATVTASNSTIPEWLLNGDTLTYDYERGFASHYIGSGCIEVELGQPYIVDSMRLLLYDLDGAAYSYKIEVSGDCKTWIVVANRTNACYCSWQTIRFNSPIPVVYVRIIGTHGRNNVSINKSSVSTL